MQGTFQPDATDSFGSHAAAVTELGIATCRGQDVQQAQLVLASHDLATPADWYRRSDALLNAWRPITLSAVESADGGSGFGTGAAAKRTRKKLAAQRAAAAAARTGPAAVAMRAQAARHKWLASLVHSGLSSTTSLPQLPQYKGRDDANFSGAAVAVGGGGMPSRQQRFMFTAPFADEAASGAPLGSSPLPATNHSDTASVSPTSRAMEAEFALTRALATLSAPANDDAPCAGTPRSAHLLPATHRTHVPALPSPASTWTMKSLSRGASEPSLGVGGMASRPAREAPGAARSAPGLRLS
ncbi:hypothetical protein EON68_02855 [archaeon]|nr:MAG: hypothetical protein EON68_02855 [archaeon]